MRRLKRLLAAVLTAAMLATFLPVGVLAAEGDEIPSSNEDVISENLEPLEDEPNGGGISEDLYVTINGEKVPITASYSLRPMPFQQYELHIRDYFPEELKAVEISDLLNMLKAKDPSADGPVAAWAKWGYVDEEGNPIGSTHDDEYVVVGEGTTIDMSGEPNVYQPDESGYSYCLQMELIIGTADQLDENNSRYRINVYVEHNYYNLLDAEVYSTDSPRQKIEVYQTGLYDDYDNSGSQRLNMWVDGNAWASGQKTNLGLKLGRSYSGMGLSAKVYLGHLESAEQIQAGGAVDITNQIWNQSGLASTGGYQADYTYRYNGSNNVEVTLVLERNGKTAMIQPMVLSMFAAELDVWLDNGLYTSAGSYSSAGNFNLDYDKAGMNAGYLSGSLYNNYGFDRTYYVHMYSNDMASNIYDVRNISAAYEGNYLTAEAAEAAGKPDIKAALFGSGHGIKFSEDKTEFLFTVVDKNGKLWHAGVSVNSTLTVSLGGLYKVSNSSYETAYDSSRSSSTSGIQRRHFTLKTGNKLSEIYYFQMSSRNPVTGNQYAANISHAYEGNYVSAAAAEASNAVDIKSRLFNSSITASYPVNFSQHVNGIDFTVIDINNRVWHFNITAEEQNLPSAPAPLSQDTYLQMRSAQKTTDDSATQYSPYVMNYLDDTYYYKYGYQTVLILNRDGSAVTDSKIVPIFTTGSKVEIYAGHNIDGMQAGAVKQESGHTDVAFVSGKAIQYSAAAENGSHLRNYFVTFLTQENSPRLFINGTNDESNWQQDPAHPDDENAKIPARVVDLTKDFNFHHDLFFANVGKTQLTGLTVELTGVDGTGGAENVQLDEYWSVKDGSTLAGFTTTSKGALGGGGSDPAGELPNVGKIRLVPQIDEETGNAKSGTISGLLTIRADGMEPVRILLTGTAGAFGINTTNLIPAVQHVSYACLIQTNLISDGTTTNSVRFTSRNLPSGMTLKSNGEFYGVPPRAGTFEFDITATCIIDGVSYSDTKHYVWTVAPNDDAPVWNYDSTLWDDSYQITVAIPNEGPSGGIDSGNIFGNATSGSNNWQSATQEFWSEGPFPTFVHRVFIDSIELIEGVDYTSREGSTRLTLQNQTLRSFGNGTHTISVESRIGDKETGVLRRAAQNYTLISLGNTTRPGSGSSSSSDRNNSSSTSHSVNLADVPGGYGSVSVDSAKPGTKVTVTITPNNGYMPAGLTVTRSNGKTIDITKVSDTEYTFIMPSSAVTVTPRFTAIPAAVGSFYDVPAEAWFCDAVKYVFDRGLMVGTSSNTFNPGGTVSRSMLVTVLYSLEGKPPVSGVSPFTDVQPDQWFTAPVIWAAENKLVAGLGNGTFGVDSPLTREQAATILYGYARLKGYDVTPSNDLSQFADTDSISAFALPALRWANAAGLISGYSQDTLAPGGTTTRAQLAVILRSFCENIAK